MRLTGDELPLDDNSSLLYCRQYLNQSEADGLLEFCLDNVHWIQSRIMMFGKLVAIPRLNAWYGDRPYRYSGTSFKAKKFPCPIHQLKVRLKEDTDWNINSVLANLYRNGNDSMGWHSDNEKSLGELPQIASVSLGAPRRFVLRSKKDHTRKHSLDLEHGSLLLMLGNCQSEWQHSLPKARKVECHRVNLTFRKSI